MVPAIGGTIRSSSCRRSEGHRVDLQTDRIDLMAWRYRTGVHTSTPSHHLVPSSSFKLWRKSNIEPGDIVLIAAPLSKGGAPLSRDYPHRASRSSAPHLAAASATPSPRPTTRASRHRASAEAGLCGWRATAGRPNPRPRRPEGLP